MTDDERTTQWTLPGYTLGPVLGRGGFGTVFLAEQVSLGRRVALKVLTADLGSAADRTRFARERDALVRLTPHPHVAHVFDAGVTPEGRPFVVMRYYPGGTLADRIARSGPLPVAETVAVVAKVAAALDAAHAIGVVHRDVKPQNVLLTEDGEPVLADFGIAGLLDDAERSAEMSTTLGSLAHAAPESLERRRFSVASDVYALASTTYQLLAGHPAFDPLDPRAGAFVVDVPPPPIPRDDVPSDVAEVVLAAMAKDPDRRPPTAGAFAAALEEALAGATAVEATRDLSRAAAPPVVPPPPVPADGVPTAAAGPPPAAGPFGAAAFGGIELRGFDDLDDADDDPDERPGGGGRRATRRPGPLARRGLAVAAVLLVAAGAGAFLLRDRSGAGPQAAAAPAAAPAGTGTAAAPTTAPVALTTALPSRTPRSRTASPSTSRAEAVTQRTTAGASKRSTRPATSRTSPKPAPSTATTSSPAGPGRPVARPSALDLGPLAAGTITTGRTVVSNEGGSPLSCTFGIMGSGFSLRPDAGTIEPGGSVTLTITLDTTGMIPQEGAGVAVVSCEGVDQFGIQVTFTVT